LIGLDTNVLVRYITQDDPDQTKIASSLIRSRTADSPGYVSLVTIGEPYWVLRRSFKTPRVGILVAFEALLHSEELVIQEGRLVEEALMRAILGNADFSDCLIECCSRAAGCTAVYTFDRKAAKSAGMQLLG
jgi:predicted nucleic-acid-binding protein